ncbi:hypothetical protein [Crassaminicella profunda]|uniref:hypothetical protein n=1 Tax=Crassaminicella profunda TaxID=1286698 RepID=UPI001CA68A1F|nr:hypothetical protein [Crassaminicella profunda]QZY53634.1 hypothetical protein K7H06_11225 [Crassaminicella profunda]
MWERIKDLLYEISDLLLAFAIILVMTTVITWKVTDSLAVTKETTATFNNITQNEKVSDETNQTSSEADANLPAVDETTNTSSEESTLPENEEQVEEIPEPSTAVETTVEPSPQPEPQQVEPTIIKVNIPSGTPGIGIAKILKEKGLIEDTSIFIKRVEELKLASKLKSGTFDIQTGSSLDNIIYMITGKKK